MEPVIGSGIGYFQCGTGDRASLGMRLLSELSDIAPEILTS